MRAGSTSLSLLSTHGLKLQIKGQMTRTRKNYKVTEFLKNGSIVGKELPLNKTVLLILFSFSFMCETTLQSKKSSFSQKGAQ